MYFRSGWIWSELKGEWQKMKAEGLESHKKTFRFCSEYIRKSWEVLKPGSDNSFIYTYKRSLTWTQEDQLGG